MRVGYSSWAHLLKCCGQSLGNDVHAGHIWDFHMKQGQAHSFPPSRGLQSDSGAGAMNQPDMSLKPCEKGSLFLSTGCPRQLGRVAAGHLHNACDLHC